VLSVHRYTLASVHYTFSHGREKSHNRSRDKAVCRGLVAALCKSVLDILVNHDWYNMAFVIKEHSASPFDIPVLADTLERSKNSIGYLADVDKYSLSYRIVNNKSIAKVFNLHDASLIVAKLNKMNMRFYEIEYYEK
jgi:hypothetical protein